MAMYVTMTPFVVNLILMVGLNHSPNQAHTLLSLIVAYATYSNVFQQLSIKYDLSLACHPLFILTLGKMISQLSNKA